MESSIDYASGRLKNSGSKRPATAEKVKKNNVIKANISGSGFSSSAHKGKKYGKTFGSPPGKDLSESV